MTITEFVLVVTLIVLAVRSFNKRETPVAIIFGVLALLVAYEAVWLV